ncbi:MAG: hypothetical protein DWP92_08295 [Armatimonadetes bacterium]|nr:MAG: hypothetical protein DWP92_08295 [Armatimonadota bacterium]
MTRQAWTAVGGAVAVMVAVVVIIVLAAVPLPDFPPVAPGQFDASLAYVTESNCIRVADLADAEVRELHCVSDRDWIDNVVWTESGIEVGVEGFQSTITVLDPDTGDVIETRNRDGAYPGDWLNQEQNLWVDVPSDGTVVIRDETNQVLVTLEGPELYGVDAVVGASDGQMVALVDSSERLAVFDRNVGQPYLVDTDARPYPPPSWQP